MQKIVDVPKNLTEFCNITRHARERVSAATGAQDGKPLIERGWSEAHDANRIQTIKAGYRFTFSAKRKDGVIVWFEVLLKASDREGAKGYFTYAVNLINDAPRKFTRLQDFAVAGKGGQTSPFDDLAGMALPEPWSFTDPTKTDLLRDYLDATFLHLQDEDKIVYGSDVEGKFAAFATGLVDRTFEDIYCLCVPNEGKVPWRIESFFTKGSRHAGKRLREALGDQLPQRASYFSQVTDIVYEGQLDLVPDYDHLMQRLGRIDLFALKSLLYTSDEALRIIQEAEGEENPGKRDALMSKISPIVAQDGELSATVKKALKNACAVAQARARYMYSSALPAWNPQRHKGGQLYFCLPLCLVDEEHVDTVLVAKKVDAARPYYEGSTLYTLQMAYRNARSIQRVDGLMGWMGAAFTPKDRGETRAESSAFESTIAPDLTPRPHLATDDPGATPVNPSHIDSSLMAVLHPQDSHMAKFVTPLAVHPGDTIGLMRKKGEPAPAIAVPRYGTFRSVSHIHGRFDHKNGEWVYSQEGQFGSDIFRIDGTSQHLERGDAARIRTGDELSLAGSLRLRFVESRR